MEKVKDERQEATIPGVSRVADVLWVSCNGDFGPIVRSY